jgi:hypothetical protein
VNSLQKAGERAVRNCANREAVNSLAKPFCLERLPEGRATARTRTAMRSGSALAGNARFAAREPHKLFTRMGALPANPQYAGIILGTGLGLAVVKVNSTGASCTSDV